MKPPFRWLLECAKGIFLIFLTATAANQEMAAPQPLPNEVVRAGAGLDSLPEPQWNRPQPGCRGESFVGQNKGAQQLFLQIRSLVLVVLGVELKQLAVLVTIEEELAIVGFHVGINVEGKGTGGVEFGFAVKLKNCSS
jgi:hypothetical protein